MCFKSLSNLPELTHVQRLYAWAVKCEGYDEKFARETHIKFPGWRAERAARKPKPKISGDGNTQKAIKARLDKKRKYTKVEESDENFAYEPPMLFDDLEDDEDSAQPFIYKPKPTRTRGGNSTT